MDRYGHPRSFGLALFRVLGEWTAGAGADVSVSCVVSEPESDWDSFSGKSCRSSQQRCKMWADCILLWDLESTSCVVFCFSGGAVLTVF